jgi:hypothetical protein
MKTWLNGGIILFGINLVLILIFFLISGGNASYDSPVSLLIIPAFLITDLLYWSSNTLSEIIIVSSISYFIIGAIIGLIVQKIKNKNPSNTNFKKKKGVKK